MGTDCAERLGLPCLFAETRNGGIQAGGARGATESESTLTSALSEASKNGTIFSSWGTELVIPTGMVIML